MSIKGTPKTLNESIENGLADQNVPLAKDAVEKHVVDYLAQKFSASMITSSDTKAIADLWFNITSQRI